jgi:hypothetical protein
MNARSHEWNQYEGIAVGLCILIESVVHVLEFGPTESGFLQLLGFDMFNFCIQVWELRAWNEQGPIIITMGENSTNQRLFQLGELLLELYRVEFVGVNLGFQKNSLYVGKSLMDDFMCFFFSSKAHLLVQEWEDDLLLEQLRENSIADSKVFTSLSW